MPGYREFCRRHPGNHLREPPCTLLPGTPGHFQARFPQVTYEPWRCASRQIPGPFSPYKREAGGSNRPAPTSSEVIFRNIELVTEGEREPESGSDRRLPGSSRGGTAVRRWLADSCLLRLL